MTINLENSISYHYDKFPPQQLDYEKLIGPLNEATAALSSYNQLLKNLHNSAILIAPLRNQEAVLSSKMEGIISTLDEILEHQAQEYNSSINTRYDVIETLLYKVSLNTIQQEMQNGKVLSPVLIRQAHQELLSFGRGRDKSPGKFKTKQNYITDKTNVAFTPIAPNSLASGLDALFDYIDNEKQIPLIKIAIAHVEFEALHPFADGNGRIGRMLITLMLWSLGLISELHFYMSHYLEENKDLYIDKMRNVSKEDNWDDWCVFFFEAVECQAIKNIAIAKKILNLYEEMKTIFADTLSSKDSIQVLDFIFTNPIFKNSQMAKFTGIGKQNIGRFTKALLERKIIQLSQKSSGRRGALYSFESLLKIVRV